MNRFFRYSGSKINYVNTLNSQIRTDKKVYCEPFIGSGAFFFFDPPYASRDSSYSAFSLDDLSEFLNNIEETEYIYTDIINECNEHIPNKILIIDILGSSPNRKQGSTGDLEYLFSSKEIININQDW